MRRIFIILLAFTFTLSLSAQNKRTTKKKAQTTQTTKKKSTTKNKKNTATYSNASIKGLQSQRAEIRNKIKQKEQALRANQADVSNRLKNLMVINSEIDDKQKSIDGIQKDISHIDNNIGILQSQLKTLQLQLNDRKAKYIKSMRYVARHRTIQDNLMFIFSAKDFVQMYRRLRFVREYGAYQKAQGEILKAKQAQVNSKHQQLRNVRGQKHTLLSKSQQARLDLQGKQSEQQEMVKGLQKQQKTIQGIIAQQRQKDAALNAQIDRLIAQEVAKARARAAAEAQRKAAANEAAKRRAVELAQKKAAAEAAAKENARRIAEAKQREAQLKVEAEAAAERKNAAEQARVEQQAREAQADREAAERKAKVDEARSKREIAAAKKDVDDANNLSSVDRMLSGGFEENKGRLPMPITGSYRIVSHFGQYSVEGLKYVTLDNKGINILGRPGAVARSIYDGEVSAVVPFGGTMMVMVRHGAYISVYCNLRSVSVSRGQKVSTRQALGAVGPDNILQFQLRRETAKLNPEAWLGR
ncbi:MAG: peptidoglycan DD-metalloendopeptidase family protein [Prevotella sp.]|jgi:septal ring factor EnvC (AmiA/AmiB activator)|nr:peptidoglycan DD-metalloendopeptidase family protein [Prevotella sp.]MCI1282226.1 peptidoglycan DD-metalloendopeptidase family protein [Prevotella sp.]